LNLQLEPPLDSRVAATSFGTRPGEAAAAWMLVQSSEKAPLVPAAGEAKKYDTLQQL
jgi:hypothetical protein